MRTELVDATGHLLRLALLALDRGERGLQRIRRRLAVAALAALVEEHRRRGEGHRDGGGLDRQRRMPEVLPREIGEAEFVVAGDLPQEVRIKLPRLHLRFGDERRRRRLRVPQQHRGRLDLQTLAGRGLDLQRRIVVGQDRAGLQLAVVLEEDMHEAAMAPCTGN